MTTYDWSPPTYNNPVDKGDRFWRRVQIPKGYSVLIVSGAATTYPGRTVPISPDDFDTADTGSGEDGKAVFLGGRLYTITTAEATILDAAGYTVTGFS